MHKIHIALAKPIIFDGEFVYSSKVFNMKKYLPINLLFCLCLPISCEAEHDQMHAEHHEEITRFDREGSAILKGVKVLAGKAIYFASGIVATPKDESDQQEKEVDLETLTSISKRLKKN